MKTNNTYIRLKITNNFTKEVYITHSYNPRVIFRFLKANIFKDCMILVSVRYQDGGKNEGEYNKKKDAIFALKAFLEK
jgi:hypothetical protein